MAIPEKDINAHIDYLANNAYKYYLSRKYKKRVFSRLGDTMYKNAFYNMAISSVKSKNISPQIFLENLIDYGISKNINLNELYKSSFDPNFKMFISMSDYHRYKITSDTVSRLILLANRGNNITNNMEIMTELFDSNQIFIDKVQDSNISNDIYNAYSQYKLIKKEQDSLWSRR